MQMTAESAAHLDLSSLLKTPKNLSADMSPSSGSLDFKELKFMKRIIILGKKKTSNNFGSKQHV